MQESRIYEYRKLGREFCETEGSEHYKGNDIEPFDLIHAQGLAENWCLGNIIKYAGRFPKSGNLNDLKKIVDYAQLLCGMYLYEAPRTEVSLECRKTECCKNAR
jgi:hypothetical protein